MCHFNSQQTKGKVFCFDQSLLFNSKDKLNGFIPLIFKSYLHELVKKLRIS